MGYTRDNIPGLYDGGVLIQSFIKQLRKDDTAGGLSAYLFILIGLSFMLYLFGYTNMYSAYMDSTKINGTVITDPVIATGINIFQLIVNSLWGIFAGMALTALALLGIASLFGVFKGASSTILTFLIPVILLMILNIFVFPIGDLSNNLGFADSAFGSAIISTSLILIFNLCYILAVIEFVRGGNV